MTAPRRVGFSIVDLAPTKRKVTRLANSVAAMFVDLLVRKLGNIEAWFAMRSLKKAKNKSRMKPHEGCSRE
jgi:hypothetical protein